MLRPLLAMLLFFGVCAAVSAAAAPVESGPAVYKDEAGKEIITYLARPPAKPRGDVRPALILGFHGSGGDAGQLVGGTAAALEQAGIRDEYVIIGLKSKAAGWGEVDDEPVRAFAAWAIKRYQIDARRVYGIGYSSGSYYLNRVVPNHSELFAGAITYVGGQYGLDKTLKPDTTAELYWIVGAKDTTVPADKVLPQMEDFRRLGLRGIFRDMRDLGHECLKEPTMADAVRWLHALRNKQLSLSAEEQAFIDRFSDADKAKRLCAESSTWQRLMQIGGPQVAPLVRQGLMSDKDVVRNYAALACTRMMFDGEVVTTLATLLDSKTAKLRETALTALAAQAGWNYPAAQAALCAFLGDVKRPLNERRATAQLLGQVTKIDLMGSFQFKAAIWGLVDALDDEDPGIRQSALAALQVADGVGFGYKSELGKAARKLLCEKWVAWCETTCGSRPATVVAEQRVDPAK